MTAAWPLSWKGGLTLVKNKRLTSQDSLTTEEDPMKESFDKKQVSSTTPTLSQVDSTDTTHDLLQAQQGTISSLKVQLADIMMTNAQNEATVSTLTYQLNKVKKQTLIDQSQLKALRNQVASLEAENMDLQYQNGKLQNECTLSRFLNGSKQVLEFPHLCPVDDTIPEGDGLAGKYTFTAALGEGHLGLVFAANIPGTNKAFAIKRIEKKKLFSHRIVAQLDLEVKALKYTQHPNVVKLHATIHGPKYFYIVMEKCMSDLHHYNERYPLSKDELRECMIGIFRALRFIHTRSFAHLDVKPDNVLCAPRGRGLTALDIRLCDFGLCVEASGQGPSVLCPGGRIVGTPNFFAPEMTDDGLLDASLADMWSAGSTLLEIAYGFPKEWQDAYEAIGLDGDAGAFVRRTNKMLGPMRKTPQLDPWQNLLVKHLLVDSASRASSTSIFHHPWFAML